MHFFHLPPTAAGQLLTGQPARMWRGPALQSNILMLTVPINPRRASPLPARGSQLPSCAPFHSLSGHNTQFTPILPGAMTAFSLTPFCTARCPVQGKRKKDLFWMYSKLEYANAYGLVCADFVSVSGSPLVSIAFPLNYIPGPLLLFIWGEG